MRLVILAIRLFSASAMGTGTLYFARIRHFMHVSLLYLSHRISRRIILPQATVFLNDGSGLCIVRDITLDAPSSLRGHITILREPVSVRYAFAGYHACYVLTDDVPVHMQGHFREEPSQEERRRHPQHRENNIYRGGCRFCDCEREAHEVDKMTRKVTHVAYQGICTGDDAAVRGLVEGATTQEDLVWVVERFSGNLDEAKEVVANHPLTKDAIWLDDAAFQELIETLPQARTLRSFVDFGDPYMEPYLR